MMQKLEPSTLGLSPLNFGQVDRVNVSSQLHSSKGTAWGRGVLDRNVDLMRSWPQAKRINFSLAQTVEISMGRIQSRIVLFFFFVVGAGLSEL